MSGMSRRLDRGGGGSSVSDSCAYVSEWVVLQNGTVVGHGPDLDLVVKHAQAKGIQRPRVVFVSRVNPSHAKLGL